MGEMELGVGKFIEPAGGADDGALVDEARKGRGIDTLRHEVREPHDPVALKKAECGLPLAWDYGFGHVTKRRVLALIPDVL
jgi:hypothetical protein